MDNLKIYYEKLYHSQDEILNLLVKSECYLYLTGGTALHRFVLENGTRYSDDIDLFTADRSIGGKDEIANFVNFLKENKIDFNIIVDTPSFKRLIIKKSGLKVDLAHDTLEHIGKFNKHKNGFLFDNIDNILLNKYDAVFSREQSRDLFDIYTIIKNSNIDLLDSFDNFQNKSLNSPEIICARIKSFPSNLIDINDIRAKDEKYLKDFIKNYQQTFFEYFDIENKAKKLKNK